MQFVRDAYEVATRIQSNATTAIPGKTLGRIVVGNAGTAWLFSVQDAAGNIQFVVSIVAGSLSIGWIFGGAGCRIVSSGTTPGDAMVLSG